MDGKWPSQQPATGGRGKTVVRIGARAQGFARVAGAVSAVVATLAGAPVAAAASTPVRALNTLIAGYLAHRPGHATAAVYDLRQNQSWSVNRSMRNQTASIVKVDILETRLHQTGGHLSARQRALAQVMIERSDNAAATALWNADGGARGIGAYNRAAGLRCTSLNQLGYWGLTTTCASDQLRLLMALERPNPLLSNASRGYQLHLMTHVVPGQDWGVTGGVPRQAGVSVALKNGWLPYGSAPWIVNSIGIVNGQGRHYMIAVLTRDPTEAQGIRTIEGVSTIVYRQLRADRPS